MTATCRYVGHCACAEIGSGGGGGALLLSAPVGGRFYYSLGAAASVSDRFSAGSRRRTRSGGC